MNTTKPRTPRDPRRVMHIYPYEAVIQDKYGMNKDHLGRRTSCITHVHLLADKTIKVMVEGAQPSWEDATTRIPDALFKELRWTVQNDRELMKDGLPCKGRKP